MAERGQIGAILRRMAGPCNEESGRYGPFSHRRASGRHLPESRGAVPVSARLRVAGPRGAVRAGSRPGRPKRAVVIHNARPLRAACCRCPALPVESSMTVRCFATPWLAALSAMGLFATAPTHAESSAEELAELAQNPVGNLISVPLENNTNFNAGPGPTTAPGTSSTSCARRCSSCSRSDPRSQLQARKPSVDDDSHDLANRSCTTPAPRRRAGCLDGRAGAGGRRSHAARRPLAARSRSSHRPGCSSTSRQVNAWTGNPSRGYDRTFNTAAEASGAAASAVDRERDGRSRPAPACTC